MPQLDLDKKHILRILVNFLSNGVKYTNQGGVTLRAKFQEDTSDTGTLQFEVEDTGIGIAEDRQLEMLKPYEQTGALQIRMEGTGLGLAISHSLIELMGGKMSLKSQLGKGSTFCVELPGVHYRKPVASGEGQPVTKACDCGTMSLLLVDDLEMNLRVLAAVCKKFGFKNIVTAHPARAAISYREISACIDKTITKIESEIIKVLQRTPPELYSNIVRNGIWLAGGGSLLRGISQRFSEKVNIGFHVAEDPLKAVARGTCLALKGTDHYPFLIS